MSLKLNESGGSIHSLKCQLYRDRPARANDKQTTLGAIRLCLAIAEGAAEAVPIAIRPANLGWKYLFFLGTPWRRLGAFRFSFGVLGRSWRLLGGIFASAGGVLPLFVVSWTRLGVWQNVKAKMQSTWHHNWLSYLE